jgi:hypothetical protein
MYIHFSETILNSFVVGFMFNLQCLQVSELFGMIVLQSSDEIGVISNLSLETYTDPTGNSSDYSCILAILPKMEVYVTVFLN